MNKLYLQAKEFLNSFSSIVIVKIVNHKGSVPRKTGSVMIVSSTGEIAGSVGGGVVEKECIEIASSVFKKKTNLAQKFILRPLVNEKSIKENDGKYVNSICNGEVNIEFYFADTISVVDKIFDKNPSPVAYIFGAGHVGSQLSFILDYLGFDVIVYDDRKEYADSSRLPYAKKVICAPYNDIIKHISIAKDDYIAIMTHGHTHDWEVLEQVLKFDSKYVGCIGSKSKVASTKEHLAKMGFSQEKLNSIHAPIGFDLKGDTPEEVAISIASEIILSKNS